MNANRRQAGMAAAGTWQAHRDLQLAWLPDGEWRIFSKSWKTVITNSDSMFRLSHCSVLCDPNRLLLQIQNPSWCYLLAHLTYLNLHASPEGSSAPPRLLSTPHPKSHLHHPTGGHFSISFYPSPPLLKASVVALHFCPIRKASAGEAALSSPEIWLFSSSPHCLYPARWQSHPANLAIFTESLPSC